MIIIAQVGSGFNDFLRQVPFGLILFFCGSGVLLTAAMFVIVRARAGRSTSTVEAPPKTRRPRPRPVNKIVTGDLPDLDLLVDAPPAAPQPTASSPTRAIRKGSFTVEVDNGETVQAVEVVTILRDVVDGGLIVQMGDHAYRSLSSDETFRSSFLKIMRELSPLVKQPAGTAETKPAAPSPPVEDDAPEPEPVAAEPPVSLRDLLTEDDEPADAAPAPIIPPPPKSDGTMPGDIPKFSLDNEPEVVQKRGTLGRTKKEFLPVPELDIAGSIEAYLQHKLEHTPEYAGRSIHVHPAPDGGVAIEVDGEFFDSVGDVDESTVQSFLATTIQEWQARNIGG